MISKQPQPDSNASTAAGRHGTRILQAEAACINAARAEVVAQSTFASGKGVALKPGVQSGMGNPAAAPDLAFRVRGASPGRYVFRTHAATDANGAAAMRRAKTKFDSLRFTLAVGEERPTSRVIFVPWSPPESCKQTTGKFHLHASDQEIRVWLPEGVRLDYLEISPYEPPGVPEAAATYRPQVVPPPTHPRIWVNQESLPGVRANLARGENAPLWEEMKRTAARPFVLAVEPGAEMEYDAQLETAAAAKAFVFLMTGAQEKGREAVVLIRDYLSAVEFGNLLDITREIGRAIYTASLVYDWCYDLMSPEDRETIRRHLMRLADEMEIGWPPFGQMIVNGHGNEAQVNRDLLCMAIAVYDEDPLPYQYCAYRILEELVPMRRFEYQSSRHNQGVSYGPHRFGWELHAAWLFLRMTGQPVFDDSIKKVCRSWLYQRLPNGETLRDGDGFADGRPASLGVTALLGSAYARDPVLKYDFQRQGGAPRDPMLVLLLNDPDLQPADGFDSLARTCYFGPVLGSMVARTGWNMGPKSSDVVVEMKGGGFHFGNHQHADAGSFQIYFRGLQVADLGQYHFYGTPYDFNFNKRSVAHSMMLALDPGEEFIRGAANDGGTRFVQTCPLTPRQARTDPTFANGTVLSADFGPSRRQPSYAYFSVDLTSAYSAKIARYVRTFCFLDLDDEGTPAALIVLDDMTTARPEFGKYWQVNTLQAPVPTTDGVVLRNSESGLSGKVDLHMLVPGPQERDLRILSGREATSVCGRFFQPPKPDRPEANGHRVMFSPRVARNRDVFLTVLCMADEQAPGLPVDLVEQDSSFVIRLRDRVVVLSRDGALLEQPLDVDVDLPAGGDGQLVVTGLAPGTWTLRDAQGGVRGSAQVKAGRNTAFFVVSRGRYAIEPES